MSSRPIQSRPENILVGHPIHSLGSRVDLQADQVLHVRNQHLRICPIKIYPPDVSVAPNVDLLLLQVHCEGCGPTSINLLWIRPDQASTPNSIELDPVVV